MRGSAQESEARMAAKYRLKLGDQGPGRDRGARRRVRAFINGVWHEASIDQIGSPRNTPLS
jgi:hypothetical protein